jgi:putative phage-type endonuclease
MALTARQLEKRKTCLGSSDMASVLGINPWKSAYAVWAEKRGIADPEPENEAMALGNLIEPAVLKFAQDSLGPIRRNQFRARPDLHLGANVDAIVVNDGAPVEAKTSGLVGRLPDGWGEGADHVPDMYIVQAHVHMIVTDHDLCHLAAFLGGVGMRLYRIQRNDKLSGVISETARHFWERFVETGVAPDESVPTIDEVKRFRRLPGKEHKVHPDLVAAVNAAKEELERAKEKAEVTQAAMLASCPDAEVFDWGDAKKCYSYYEQTRTGVDSAALRADHPDIWKKYSTISLFRVLRMTNKPT